MEIVTTPAIYYDDLYYQQSEYDNVADLSGNGSGDGEDEFWENDWDNPIRITYMVLYSVVCALGVLGNGAVIWVTGFRMKKTVSTVWYLNLAVADLLVTAFLTLDIMYYALDYHWPFGQFVCKLEGLVFYVNTYTSTFTLAAISGNRCVSVLCPVWTLNHCTVRNASWVSLGVWMTALALSSPYIIFRDTMIHDDNKIMCFDNYALVADYNNSTQEENQLRDFRLFSMVITHLVVGFVLPFSVIVSCYSVIISRLRKSRSLASQSGRSFKIVATVISAFFLCWLPYHIIDVIDIGVTEYNDTLELVKPISNTLALLNSCLNPLLYVFMAQGFKELFRCRSILRVLEKAFSEDHQPSYRSRRSSVLPGT